MSQAADEQSDNERGLFPVPSKWFTIGMYLFFLLWLLYLLWEATTYAEFQDYFFPYLTGAPLVVLILVQLLMIQYPQKVEAVLPDEDAHDQGSKEDLGAHVEKAQTTRGRESKAEKEMYEIYMIVWVALLPLMMYFLGMGWTLLIYVFAFVWFFTRSLKWSAITTLAMIAFVYILFVYLLRLIIWQGVWGLPDPLSFLKILL